jgi:hypothetical protein
MSDFENRTLRKLFGAKRGLLLFLTEYPGDDMNNEVGGTCGTHR